MAKGFHLKTQGVFTAQADTSCKIHETTGKDLLLLFLTSSPLFY